MRRQFLFLGAMVMASLAGGLVLVAAPPGGQDVGTTGAALIFGPHLHFEPRQPWPMSKEAILARVEMFRETVAQLDLSPEQQARADAIIKDLQASCAEWYEKHADELTKVHDEVKAALAAKDRDAFEKARAPLLGIKSSLPKGTYAVTLNELLTPEQKALFKEKMQATVSRMHEEGALGKPTTRPKD